MTTEKKKRFTCHHKHDYSTIELDTYMYVEIKNYVFENSHPDEIKEHEATKRKVEYITELLNNSVSELQKLKDSLGMNI